jgi:Undecaprenyl-phosphate galactose phosphotransferase WbaP
MRHVSLRRPFYIASLIAIDIGAYTLAFYCAVKTRIFLGTNLEAIPAFVGDAMRFEDLYFMPIMFLVIFFYEGLYHRRAPFIDELREIGKSLAILTIILFAFISVGRLTHLVSRMTIVMMPLYALIFIGIGRYWGKIFLHKASLGTQNLLIVGEYKAAARIKSELLAERTLGYKFCGYVPINARERAMLKSEKDSKLFYAGDLKDLATVLNHRRIECALIAAPGMSRENTGKLADRAHRYVRHVLLIPEMSSGALLNSEFYHLFVNQLFLIKIRNTLSERASRFTKLAFDYLMVMISLPFAIPILLLLALFVKLSSPGPALFTQIRIGQHGKSIRVYKFRSMYSDADARLQKLLAGDRGARAEWKKDQKLKNDPRITRCGALLRKTSLDELPQLINVLKGEMSLVGPRPVPLDELIERYADKADYYKLVRPGMTGLWQISGRSDISYDQRVNMDTWYVFNWSLYIDLVILYKTIGVVVKRRGAY